jgi:hypothetical protein
MYTRYLNEYSNVLGEVHYDHHPLFYDDSRSTGDKTYVKDDYYQNFELVATQAKNNGYPTGVTIQSSGWGAEGDDDKYNRVPETKADIGFQVYSALAYGMKNLSYYTYWEHIRQSETQDVYGAMVMYPEKNGQEAVKTPIYYAVQEVNQEIKNFDHIYMRYNWQGTIAVPKTGASKSELLSGVSNYTSTRIQTITASEEAIVGCMVDSQGFDGFMIVNATDPGKNLSNTITVQFNDAKKALCYINGERQVVPLDNGEFEYEFAAGQGIFIIPINE